MDTIHMATLMAYRQAWDAWRFGDRDPAVVAQALEYQAWLEREQKCSP